MFDVNSVAVENEDINSYLNIAALKRLPYIMSAEEAVSFFRLPIYGGIVVPITINKVDEFAVSFIVLD